MVTENSGWNKVEPQNAETTCSCVFIFLIPRVVLAYWTHLNPLGRHPKSSETKTLRLRPWLLRLFVLESLEPMEYENWSSLQRQNSKSFRGVISSTHSHSNTWKHPKTRLVQTFIAIASSLWALGTAWSFQTFAAAHYFCWPLQSEI